MYIVKFGGSAITDKRRPYTFRPGRIARAARLLRGRRAVLIHGAGSFAHPHVKAYGLTPLGIAAAKAALRRLTAYVVEELASAGIYAMPVEPSDVFWGGRLARPEVVGHALDHGLYPLLHGDIVPSDGGYVVVSGDDMAVELARLYRPAAVIFLMDVDGIYTGPPGSPGARRLDRIEGPLQLEGTAGVDVTGGVAKKVESGLSIAALGARVYYCSIEDLEAVEAALEGREADCTSIPPLQR